MNVTDPIRERAQANPDAPAVVGPDGTVAPYRELERTINLVAAGVRRLGFGPGALLAVRTNRPYRHLCVRLALARLGIGIAPGAMRARGIDACLADGDTRDETWTRFEKIERLWPRNSAAAHPVDAIPSHQDSSAVFALFPTSGTSGEPRYVGLSHELAAQRLSVSVPMTGISGVVRELCTIGIETSYCFLSRLRVLWNGGVVVMAHSSPKRMLGTIEDQRVNRLVAAPLTLNALARARSAGLPRPDALEQIETGGSALPAPLFEIVRERLCANVITRYGATETGYVASAPVASLISRPGAVGYVDARVEMQAVDAAGLPLPPGMEGELRVRSPGCASAYYGDPEGSAGVFRAGWVYPGDSGTLDDARLLTLSGRSSELIDQVGNKVSPSAIEAVLLSEPGLKDAAAFGVPNPLGVTMVWAAIVHDGRVDVKALWELCRERLGTKAPVRFLMLRELPRNEAGKVLRGKLAEKAIEAMAKRQRSPASR